MRAVSVVFLWGVLAGAVLMTFIGCDVAPPLEVTRAALPVGYAEPLVSSLPQCPANVGGDHYCPNGKVACWDNPNLPSFAGMPAAGISGCSVEISHTGGVLLRVECSAGCNEPGAPLPAPTMEGTGNVKWCHAGVDADGLEQATCEWGVGISPYGFPPYVMRCVAACPTVSP